MPPKKPYSFLAILDDILDFASETLVDHGRLSFWMPTANDEEQEIPVPKHPCLELVAVCVQVFNKCNDPPPPFPLISDQSRSKYGRQDLAFAQGDDSIFHESTAT